MHRNRAVQVLWLLALVVTSAAAHAQGARPGINKPFEQLDWQQSVRMFENPGREIYARREAIVAASGVAPGMTVADIGAGTGLFTRLFAQKVAPTGKVYAVDISRSFIENILRTCREQGITNVEGIVNPRDDASLPESSIDLAFISDTYHHFEYPQRMMASLHRALRPGGRLIIIDFRRIPGYSTPWVMQHVRAGRQTVIREVQAAGFRFREEKPVLRSNYFLEFTRTGQ
jgi:ubiquinone/menaquinone biosynthesis C-methylase UbiE